MSKSNAEDFHSGKRLKFLRESNELTQDNLASEPNFPIKDDRNLRRWEKDGIPAKHIESVATFFGIDSLLLQATLSEEGFMERYGEKHPRPSQGWPLSKAERAKADDLKSTLIQAVEQKKAYFDNPEVSIVEVSLAAIQLEKADEPHDPITGKERFVLNFLEERTEVARQPYNRRAWNAACLEIMGTFKQQLEEHIAQKNLLLRGRAWLSFWMALGYVFVRNSGYRLSFHSRNADAEVGSTWDSWASPKSIHIEVVECLDLPLKEGCAHDEIAIAISLSNDIRQSVESALENLNCHQCYFLSLEKIRYVAAADEHEATGIAESVWEQMRAIQNRAIQNRVKVNKIHLFYSGPLEVACFFGHHFYQFPPIQLYDYDANREGDNKYYPSFLLE